MTEEEKQEPQSESAEAQGKPGHDPEPEEKPTEPKTESAEAEAEPPEGSSETEELDEEAQGKTPFVQIPKPEASLYKDNRKLFLVPTFPLGPDAPAGGRQLVERYWSEVRDHVQKLERGFGSVTRVYHETVFDGGDEGLGMIESLNPQGYSFIQAICRSTAKLEPTEDRAAIEESSDWRRVMSIGLVSEAVYNKAFEGLQESSKRRNDHIARSIDESLEENDVGVLFIREDHRVTFPTGIQVFYVAPPSLDAIKRWIADQVRLMTEAAAAGPQGEPEPEAEEGSSS